MDDARTVTVLLRDWQQGDERARERLIEMVYEELRRIASRQLRRERPDHTLHATDLVSEAYLRLSNGAQPEWKDRIHFFAIAARSMRQILVDHARRHRAGKRDGGIAQEFDDQIASVARGDELLALDDALTRLAIIDERKARMMELHYFTGLNHQEIATALDIHVNTVARNLRLAEAWVHRSIEST